MPTPPTPHFTPWIYFSTCKQSFTGLVKLRVKLRLVVALWKKHARAVEMNLERRLAVNVYLMALSVAGEHAEAARLQRGILDADDSGVGPGYSETLGSASSMGHSLSNLG